MNDLKEAKIHREGEGCGDNGEEGGILLFFFKNLEAFTSEDTEKALAPHSSTLAWKIPWTAEPGRLQSMGS